MPPKPEGTAGTYHRLEKGQTLWRISKLYDIDVDELAKINRISDPTNIETGQLIFVPYQGRQPDLSGKTSSGFEDFIWPVKGKVVETFGQVYNGMVSKGINIQPYKGKDEVIAARSGKVVFCGRNFKDFGKTIIIEHADGFSTVYAHNSEVFVKSGDNVQKGMAIAKTGSAYSHFQIRKGHIPRNPFFYLPR